MKTISQQLLATEQAVEKPLKNIPRNIFQTYASRDLTDNAFAAVNSWREKNPTWSHYFFTDAEQRAFINEHFSDDVLWAYDQIIPGAYRADLWRYCVLFIKGGVYADHKLICNIPLDTVIPEDLHFATYQDRPMSRHGKWSLHFYLWQAFIVSEPGHPFLKQAIDNIVENAQQGYYGHDTLCITGPGLLGKSVNQALNRPEQTPITAGQYSENGLDYTILDNPFAHKNFAKPNPSFLQHKDFMGFYQNYHKERAAKSFQASDKGETEYATTWFLNRVYRHGKCIRNPEDLYFKTRAAGILRRKARDAYKCKRNDLAFDYLQKTLAVNFWQPKAWKLWLLNELFQRYIFKKK